MILTAPLLQTNSWRFDWRSALIGVLAAWIIALLVYQQRETLHRLAQQAWEPVARWRAKTQSSVEEKYLRALQESLKDLLLFTPEDPEAIFVPPTFLALAPLPISSTESQEEPATLRVTFPNLLDGHPRLLLTGTPGSGRTTALVMTTWLVAEKNDAGENRDYRRFPLWIDLAQLAAPPDTESDPLVPLADLATQFLPRALPKWILKQLAAEPSLILVDNWEHIPSDTRAATARWIGAAADALPDSIWLIATDLEGYGPLVESNFVPVTLDPARDQSAITTLYTGWATLLGNTEKPLEGPTLYTLLWAKETGDPLIVLTLRTILELRTGATPYSLVEVLDALAELYVPLPDLGEEQTETAQEAQRLAFKVLEKIGWTAKNESRTAFSPQEIDELLKSLLPPAAELPPKLESTARNLIHATEFMQREGKSWRFRHEVWRDYFAARALLEEEAATERLLEQLYNLNWAFLLDCYAGLGDATPLVKARLQQSLTQDDCDGALSVARWATIAPESAPWRKALLKVLARFFAKDALDTAPRLQLAHALALVAGESARAFYLQMLRNPNLAIRQAALRGLGWTGTPKEMRILAAGLNDKHFEMQVSAVRALGDLGTSGAFRFLKDSLYRSDEQLMLIIAETLAGSPEGWEALQEATEADDLLIRRAAAHGLGYIQQAWASQILLTMTREDPQWLVRSAAEAALAAQAEVEAKITVPAPPEVETLQWLMSWAAKQGLGLGVGEAALQMLLRTLEMGEPEVQMLGARTLQQFGRQAHLEVLVPLLNSTHPEVQQAASAAYTAIEQRYRGVTSAASEEEAVSEVSPASPPDGQPA